LQQKDKPAKEGQPASARKSGPKPKEQAAD